MYSPILVSFGRHVWLPGLIGAKPNEDRVVSGGLEAEFAEIMEQANIELAKVGMTRANIVSARVMVVRRDSEKYPNIDEMWKAFNVVWLEALPGRKPVRDFAEYADLCCGACLEIVFVLAENIMGPEEATPAA